MPLAHGPHLPGEAGARADAVGFPVRLQCLPAGAGVAFQQQIGGVIVGDGTVEVAQDGPAAVVGRSHRRGSRGVGGATSKACASAHQGAVCLRFRRAAVALTFFSEPKP